jgi:hypothetical protein
VVAVIIGEFRHTSGTVLRPTRAASVATSPLRVPVSIVARVRVPTGLIFDVLRMLNKAMTDYEAIFGEIRRPEAR